MLWQLLFDNLCCSLHSDHPSFHLSTYPNVQSKFLRVYYMSQTMLNSWNKTSAYHRVYSVMVESNLKKNCIKKALCPNKHKEQHVVGTWWYLTALLSTSCISVTPLWSLYLFLFQHALTPEPTVLSQLMCLLLVSHIFCLFLAYDMKPHKRYIILKFVTNSMARHLNEIFVRLNSVRKICVGIMSCLCAYAIYCRRADEMKCPL